MAPRSFSPLCLFLSTPSARRATDSNQMLFIRKVISIHALREEGDPVFLSLRGMRPNFYPRPPRGGRPLSNTQIIKAEQFLSTPSARRATAAAQG